MSMLMRPSTSGAVIEISVGKNDDSIQPADYRVSLPGTFGVADGLRFTDILWTRSSFPIQNFINGFSGLDGVHQYWEWNVYPTGNQQRKVISGFVYDLNGNPVSGANVYCFNTATNLLVDSAVSGPDGSYTITDPNAVQCFLVAYLPGSPDTAGTTVDTIAGS